MDKQLALSITGGLSKPSKMPGWSFSIPAQRCHTGMRLRPVKTSICASCYALRGRYLFGAVKAALQRRFDGLRHPQWVEAMTYLISVSDACGFFRWFDSGDLQGEWHLRNIVKVCGATPNVRHWLPTREYGIVNKFLKSGDKFPPNLTVRVSAYLKDGPPPAWAVRAGLVTSGVSRSAGTCPAPSQGGKCLTCRACWDKSVRHVVYHAH